MEKELIGEMKDWEKDVYNWYNVCKEADKLFKKGWINAIEIISKKEYIDNNKNIYRMIILKNETHLEEIFSCYLNSKMYELCITKVIHSDNEYNLMLVLYW